VETPDSIGYIILVGGASLKHQQGRKNPPPLSPSEGGSDVRTGLRLGGRNDKKGED